ncbi:MAG: GTP cyclohydrolase [Flammeovirgaceae bacterium]|mgnify:CR=1 FL=1|jgi:hypothetical protein|nr:GTP cyclohydrolase [Flammeovirgaceae bacterium]
MKIKNFITSNFSQRVLVLLAIVTATFLISCNDEDPVKEDTPELITKATLTFTPTAGGTPVVATASDPDGEGVQDIIIDGPINLTTAKSYTLTIELINQLVDPSAPEYDVTEEVREDGDEHLFFFAWTNNVFSDPSGNGNVDNRADKINYNDEDDMGLPIGLSTTWTTSGSTAAGTFRIILKHQPDQKSASSDQTMGDTDLDLTFTINVN